MRRTKARVGTLLLRYTRYSFFTNNLQLHNDATTTFVLVMDGLNLELLDIMVACSITRLLNYTDTLSLMPGVHIRDLKTGTE